MFTGIVRERARVVSYEDGRLVVETGIAGEIGDSVALDGICLTVVANGGGRLAFDVIPESRTVGKEFGPEVNVEPALRAGEPLGGHYVQGHVDGVGAVRAVEDRGGERRAWIEPPEGLLRYIVQKGSITVDGVALTVTGLAEGAFEVALVPHTLEVTTLRELRQGGRVNLEVDVLAKYVEQLLPR